MSDQPSGGPPRQRRRPRRLAARASLLCLLATTCSAGGWRFSTPTGWAPPPTGQLLISLPEGWDPRLSCEAIELSTGKPVAIQSLSESNELVIDVSQASTHQGGFDCLVTQRPPAQTRRASPDSASGATGVKCVVEETALEISINRRRLLRYHLKKTDPPESVGREYSRSGYLHPVVTAAGRVVTGAYPPEHRHQCGIFNGWVRTELAGRPFDFWNLHRGLGEVRHAELLSVFSGQLVGGFSVRRDHVAAPHDGEPTVVIEERWDVRAYATAPGRVFDLVSTQRCVAPMTLEVKRHHYGGMAFRGPTAWRGRSEHGFLTSEGKGRREGDHTRPDWVSIYGPIDGVTCGCVVFSHPENLRSPQPVRLNPVMPYFAFSPPIEGPFSLAPGDSLTQRYRYFLFDGELDASLVGDLWADYRASGADVRCEPQ